MRATSATHLRARGEESIETRAGYAWLLLFVILFMLVFLPIVIL